MALLFVSILPVIILALYIYYEDSDKEPIGLLIKLFFGGVGAVFLSFIISFFLSILFPNFMLNEVYFGYLKLFFHVFLGVALVEEFSKWLFLYRISFNHREFDHVYDMIVYSVFVALGFACFENILYVLENGFQVAIIRALLAVPGHACDGIFMGYYLSLTKLSFINGNDELRKHNKILSLFVPVLLHGIYDFCLFTENIFFIILFFIFIIILYVKSIRRVKRMSSVSGNMKVKM